MPEKGHMLQPPNPKDYINCPLDLDALIMAPNTTPDVVELNCALADDNILFDAIRLSTCAYWMFKLDVLEQFSNDFKLRLYNCLPALARTTRMYFNYQIENSPAHKELNAEYKRFLLETGLVGCELYPLQNPLAMLSNNMREADQRILNGQMTPRQMLLDQIQQFLKMKDKGKIDFSYSLFLPEFLNPKFFQELTEAEQIVLVGNIAKYFDYLAKFHNNGPRLFGSIKSRNELFPPQALVKHILLDEGDTYTHRVKTMAWNALCSELEKSCVNGTSGKMFLDSEVIRNNIEEVDAKLKKKGLSFVDIGNWLNSSENVFEAFELDCTLHNVDATDFLLHLLTFHHRPKYNMVRGLMDFQDTETKNKLFKVVGKAMTPFR